MKRQIKELLDLLHSKQIITLDEDGVFGQVAEDYVLMINRTEPVMFIDISDEVISVMYNAYNGISDEFTTIEYNVYEQVEYKVFYRKFDL
jgi:hypothetical protein